MSYFAFVPENEDLQTCVVTGISERTGISRRSTTGLHTFSGGRRTSKTERFDWNT